MSYPRVSDDLFYNLSKLCWDQDSLTLPVVIQRVKANSPKFLKAVYQDMAYQRRFKFDSPHIHPIHLTDIAELPEGSGISFCDRHPPSMHAMSPACRVSDGALVFSWPGIVRNVFKGATSDWAQAIFLLSFGAPIWAKHPYIHKLLYIYLCYAFEHAVWSTYTNPSKGYHLHRRLRRNSSTRHLLNKLQELEERGAHPEGYPDIQGLPWESVGRILSRTLPLLLDDPGTLADCNTLFRHHMDLPQYADKIPCLTTNRHFSLLGVDGVLSQLLSHTVVIPYVRLEEANTLNWSFDRDDACNKTYNLSRVLGKPFKDWYTPSLTSLCSDPPMGLVESVWLSDVANALYPYNDRDLFVERTGMVHLFRRDSLGTNHRTDDVVVVIPKWLQFRGIADCSVDVDQNKMCSDYVCSVKEFWDKCKAKVLRQDTKYRHVENVKQFFPALGVKEDYEVFSLSRSELDAVVCHVDAPYYSSKEYQKRVGGLGIRTSSIPEYPVRLGDVTYTAIFKPGSGGNTLLIHPPWEEAWPPKSPAVYVDGLSGKGFYSASSIRESLINMLDDDALRNAATDLEFLCGDTEKTLRKRLGLTCSRAIAPKSISGNLVPRYEREVVIANYRPNSTAEQKAAITTLFMTYNTNERTALLRKIRNSLYDEGIYSLTIIPHRYVTDGLLKEIVEAIEKKGTPEDLTRFLLEQPSAVDFIYKESIEERLADDKKE
jgi:hypothetical protein